MKPITPIRYWLTRFWTAGFTFWEAYFLILTAAILFGLWLKWKVWYTTFLFLAVAFYAIPPQTAWHLAKAKWQQSFPGRRAVPSTSA